MKAGWAGGLALAAMLCGCGTRYEMPVVGTGGLDQANRVIVAESAPSGAVPPAAAVERFDRVARRVAPVTESMCRQETPDQDCTFEFVLDTNPRAEPNAFQTESESGPVIVLTLTLLESMRDDDEVAFVLGHEAGHHIARHLAKQEAQATYGALMLGAAAAAYVGQRGIDEAEARRTVAEAMTAGAAIGGAAYSQTYELEADVIGAYVAEAAGYDAEKGALLFARPEGGNVPGGGSIWSSHPSSPERIATVRAAAAEARADRAAGRPVMPEGR